MAKQQHATKETVEDIKKKINELAKQPKEPKEQKEQKEQKQPKEPKGANDAKYIKEGEEGEKGEKGEEGNNDVEIFLRKIKTGEIKNVVVMLGANNFGVDGSMQYYNTNKNMELNQKVFKNMPRFFYKRLARPWLDLYEAAKETYLHHFLQELAKKCALRRVYTQNFHALETKFGLSNKLVVQVHGSILDIQCIKCRRPYDVGEWKEALRANTISLCKYCSHKYTTAENKTQTREQTRNQGQDQTQGQTQGQTQDQTQGQIQGQTQGQDQTQKKGHQIHGPHPPEPVLPSFVGPEGLYDDFSSIIRPMCSLYGEDLSPDFRKNLLKDFEVCDLLLVMGCNLEVYPFASLICGPKESVPRVLINKYPSGPWSNAAPSASFIATLQSVREKNEKKNQKDENKNENDNDLRKDYYVAANTDEAAAYFLKFLV